MIGLAFILIVKNESTKPHAIPTAIAPNKPIHAEPDTALKYTPNKAAKFMTPSIAILGIPASEAT